jgi:hypothetical protein
MNIFKTIHCLLSWLNSSKALAWVFALSTTAKADLPFLFHEHAPLGLNKVNHHPHPEVPTQWASKGQTINAVIPQGNSLRSDGTFTRTDGTTSGVYDAVFGNDQTDTVYRGESGQAAWAGPHAIDVKGFGRITNLAVASANDFELAELLTTRAAAMTVADLHTLAVQAGDVLGAWGATQPLTRELTPVLTSADGKTLLDRAIYVEDAIGGYWTCFGSASNNNFKLQSNWRAA